jgi:hypothetical protein
MTLYEVYHDTECPRCGNTEDNHDHGPYEVAFPGLTADHGCPEVHYMCVTSRRSWRTPVRT